MRCSSAKRAPHAAGFLLGNDKAAFRPPIKIWYEFLSCYYPTKTIIYRHVDTMFPKRDQNQSSRGLTTKIKIVVQVEARVWMVNYDGFKFW